MPSPERTEDEAPGAVPKARRQVVVAGDVTIDWNLARTRKIRDGGTSWNAEDQVETYCDPGGAAVLARVVAEVGTTLQGDDLAVDVAGPLVETGSMSPGDPRFHHSYAIWSQHPRRMGDRDSVWRVEEFLGMDRSRFQQGGQHGRFFCRSDRR